MVADLIFIGLTLVKIGCVIGFLLFMVSYTVMAERRFSAMIQDRIGPNRTGVPFTKISLWGLGQPIADAFKLMLKEQFTPAHVNKLYYYMAPVLAVVPPLIVAAVIPFGSAIDLRPLVTWCASFFGGLPQDMLNLFNIPAVIADFDIGLLFVFAIVSLGVYGIILAGWSSNSKYPFLGGIRASAQMISYEISMGLAVVPVFLAVEHFSLTQIVRHQVDFSWLALPPFTCYSLPRLAIWIPLFISFIIFLVSAFAETNRHPFDMPECESELIGGFNTEYASMKFALFFLGEYAALISASAIIVTLFLGGWSLPLPWFNGLPMPETVPYIGGLPMPWWFGFAHIGVFVTKVALMISFFIWIRWTLPRFRYDQLMNLGWKFFIPLAFTNIFLTAFLLMNCRPF